MPRNSLLTHKLTNNHIMWSLIMKLTHYHWLSNYCLRQPFNLTPECVDTMRISELMNFWVEYVNIVSYVNHDLFVVNIKH